MVSKDSLEELLKKKVPLQAKRIKEAFQSIEQEDERELLDYVDLWLKKGYSLESIVDCYKFIVDVTNREQLLYARKSEGYQKTQTGVDKNVYADADYMRKYMLGLAISMFIWKQHIELYHFFKERVDNNADHGGRYLEIGAGHGLFARYALRKGDFSKYCFIDISQTGIELTRECLESVNDGDNLRFQCLDFLDTKEQDNYSFICAGEVIEAVPDARAFLKRCTEALKWGGVLYLSAPINTAVPDTVTLFGTIENLEALIKEVGLLIKDHIYCPYYRLSLEESIEKHMPINVGYLLEKQR